MQGNDDRRQHRRYTRVLTWAERLFVIGGIATLGWCALLLGDAALSQWQARRALDVISLAASVGTPDDDNVTRAPRSRAAALHNGSVVGELSIPRLALDAVVLHGSDTLTLRRAPGHLEHTALPGTAGNVVIAGHRDSFFRPLKDVAVGDDVFIDTAEGHFQYRVTSTHVVDAQDVSVLEQTGDATLTLITCYPFWVLGPAPDRFVVRGELVGKTSFATFSALAPAWREPLSQTPSVVDARGQQSPTEPVAHDDATLVRQAIERFRTTYNARLVSHNDVRPGGSLEFFSCDIAVADDSALASCITGSPSEASERARMWTIRLERGEQVWSIKTVVSDE